MKNVRIFHFLWVGLLFASSFVSAQNDTLRLSLNEAIRLAQLQSVDAAVALNELKTAYWEYHTYRAERLPEVNFTGVLPSYNNNYGRYQQADGSYTYIQNNWMRLNGSISIDQNIALTGGKVSLNSSLDLTRQLGKGSFNEYMSIPLGITLIQPVFGVNDQKWKQRIEPLRYREAKAAYVENTEEVALAAIASFFQLLYARENLNIALQNRENADRLYEIALAKRKIGYLSEGELMQLEFSALQAKGFVTEAQSNLNACMFQLRSFLILDEQTAIEPLLPESAPSVRIQYPEALEKAQENNSFAKNILRRQLEAEYEVASAKGNQRSINLFASVGYTGKDYVLDAAYQRLKGNQAVEVGMNIPLLDWGKRKGKVKVAESNREVILSKIRQEQMNFNQDIFLLVENFNNQAGQLEIARQADRIAEKRYNISIETFVIGKISILDLNDARKSKDEARLKHIQELSKYWIYYYNIRSITLYDFLSGNNLDSEFEVIVKR
jgi:outer membrane protein TolC